MRHSHTFNFCAIFLKFTCFAFQLIAFYEIAIQHFRFISSIRNDGWMLEVRSYTKKKTQLYLNQTLRLLTKALRLKSLIYF